MPGMFHRGGKREATLLAERERRHEREEEEEEERHPDSNTMCSFCASATMRGIEMLGDPERETAPEKRPRERGEERRAKTDVPPEDWPMSAFERMNE
jgi:hypothetical protein